ncbi:type II toxin-antitoxin system VapC family toxin [Candidatus Palauibacter sp.]|uniref:type II toxin-antitoxin system VapC family toxin n=1 Tax=Candidatus Palauibacter sp. TaxID=3101350 RepID=UPI003B01D3C2
MILLDTQILVWIRTGDGRIGKRARRRIDKALQDGDLAVSAISFWEIAMLQEKARLEIRLDVASWRRSLLRDGLVEIPVDGATGIRATRLRGFHSDPADRLIVATALAGHRLVTADRRILKWPGRLDRIDAAE